MHREGNLIAAIAELENLRIAFHRAARGKAAKREVRRFRAGLDAAVKELHRGLLDGDLTLGAHRFFRIYDPKERLICAASFPERVVHHAIICVCERIFERFLIGDSYACRKGRGRLAAIARARRFASRHPFYLKLDVRHCFERIDHAILLRKLARLFKDRALLDLFRRIIAVYETSPGKGIPIGNLTSQHFANFYLGYLDRFVKETLRAKAYVRYMDDCVLWDEERSTLRSVRDAIVGFLREELALELKPAQINHTVCGMDFLGFRIFPRRARLNRRNARRLARRWRWLHGEEALAQFGERGVQTRQQAIVAFAEQADSLAWRRGLVAQCPEG